MSDFAFRDREGRDVPPHKWLADWAGLYPESDYAGYEELISNHRSLTAGDIERIGKWKDAAKAKRWGPNVASVAYPVWMEAAASVPLCPADGEVRDFLTNWSERTYTDQYANKRVTKRFGLSRASTLLHFVSGGRFPIVDSRVRAAISRLLDMPVKNSVQWYCESYCRVISEIATACGTTDLRLVDKALFSYGGKSGRGSGQS